MIQVDLAARDRVGDAQPGKPGRGGREREVPDDGEGARDQQARPHERKGRRPARVQPEQVAAGRREMKREIEDPERTEHARQPADLVLHVALDEDVQRALDRRDRLPVADGIGTIARDQAPAHLVHGVEREDDGCLGRGVSAARRASRRGTAAHQAA